MYLPDLNCFFQTLICMVIMAVKLNKASSKCLVHLVMIRWKTKLAPNSLFSTSERVMLWWVKPSFPHDWLGPDAIPEYCCWSCVGNKHLPPNSISMPCLLISVTSLSSGSHCLLCLSLYTVWSVYSKWECYW